MANTKRSPNNAVDPLVRQVLDIFDTQRHKMLVLAADSGVEVASLSALRTGRKKHLQVDTLRRLADAVGYDLVLRPSKPEAECPSTGLSDTEAAG